MGSQQVFEKFLVEKEHNSVEKQNKKSDALEYLKEIQSQPYNWLLR